MCVTVNPSQVNLGSIQAFCWRHPGFVQVKVLKGEGLPTNYRSQTANISVKISLLPSRLPKVKIETHPPGCKKILDRNSFLLDRNSFFLLDRNSTRLGLSRTPLTLSSMRSSASSSPGFFQSFSQILWNDLSLWGQTRKFSISFILFREDTKGKVLRLTLLDHDREGKRWIQTFWSCLVLFGFCSWITALWLVSEVLNELGLPNNRNLGTSLLTTTWVTATHHSWLWFAF